MKIEKKSGIEIGTKYYCALFYLWFRICRGLFFFFLSSFSSDFIKTMAIGEKWQFTTGEIKLPFKNDSEQNVLAQSLIKLNLIKLS